MKINRIRRASYQMIYDCRVGSFVIPNDGIATGRSTDLT